MAHMGPPSLGQRIGKGGENRQERGNPRAGGLSEGRGLGIFISLLLARWGLNEETSGLPENGKGSSMCGGNNGRTSPLALDAGSKRSEALALGGSYEMKQSWAHPKIGAHNGVGWKE